MARRPQVSSQRAPTARSSSSSAKPSLPSSARRCGSVRYRTRSGRRSFATCWSATRVRWKMEPATSGAVGGQAIHLIVQTGRTRAFDLHGRHHITAHLSHPAQVPSDPIMARVGFFVPRRCFRQARRRQCPPRSQRWTGRGVSADQLNFSYTVRGNASWRPTRVYSDRPEDLHPISAFTHRTGCARPFRRFWRTKHIVNYRHVEQFDGR